MLLQKKGDKRIGVQAKCYSGTVEIQQYKKLLSERVITIAIKLL